VRHERPFGTLRARFVHIVTPVGHGSGTRADAQVGPCRMLRMGAAGAGGRSRVATAALVGVTAAAALAALTRRGPATPAAPERPEPPPPPAAAPGGRGTERTALITAAAALISALVAIATVTITAVQTNEGQTTDRYIRAVAQLGDPALDVRLGGIYALGRLAHDSRTDRASVTAVIAAFARDHVLDARDPACRALAARTDPPVVILPNDARAAIQVLGGLNPLSDPPVDQNLANVCLPRTDIIAKATLPGVNLSGADLESAYLSASRLGGADLTFANLHAAHVNGVDLSHADLRGADLTGADLTGAILDGALLDGAKLQGAVGAEQLAPH
jgi:hypothetical protein